MGGVAEVLDEDGFIRRRRLYDGTLLGEWPAHPPRYSKPVNPEKARLAAEEEAA
jgi:hypothetical protein